MNLRTAGQSVGLCFLLSVTASSQVALTANLPVGNAGSSYNYQVLPGAQRQISVHLTGGTTNLINWTIGSTTGGASATLDRGQNAIGVVNVVVGPAAGKCSISGTVGAYAVSSPATVTVQAQSVDDPSKTANFLFNVCANTTTVYIAPGYQQAYKGQQVELQSYVVGNVNEAGTWSITSQPLGGDGNLPDVNFRDALFSASVTGRYVLTYTSSADQTKSATAIVYVSPNAIPSYGLGTPNLTQSTECYPDPQLTGKDYEVGPARAFKTINSVPLSTMNAGSIVRIHNDDTTSSSPTTYQEIVFLNGAVSTATDGTPTQPQIVCGVPDSAGHLPIINAANGTGGTQPYGAFSVWSGGTYNSPYTNGSAGTDHIIISGLEIENANQNTSYIPAGGGAAVPFNAFASCMNIRSGTYIMVAGNDLHDCGNGMFVANNSNGNGYSQVTQFFTIRGNRFHNNGISGDAGKHHLYLGSWYTAIEGNRFENLNGLGGGQAIKDRGLEPIHRYNLFQTPNSGYLDAINSEQDSQPYVVFEPLLGAQGATCNQSIYCSFEQTITADQVAAYQEGLEKIFLYGNIYSSRALFLADVEVADSGGDQGYAWTNQTEMADHLGWTYFYSNTVDNPMLSVFATLSGTNNGGEPTQQPLKPTVFAANNIFYKAKTGTINIFAFARNASIIGNWQTNLMNKGTFDNTIPINGQPSTNVTAVNGWQNYSDTYQYPGDIPINTHQTGLAPANFLETDVQNHQPYNGATYAAVTGAGAIGAASTITNPVASLLPVRSQYEVETGKVIPRTNLSTIGAVDPGSAPTLVSLQPTASAQTFLSNANTSLSCNYGGIAPCLPQFTGALYVPIPIALNCMWSDGLVNDCSPNAVFATPKLTFYGNNTFIPTTVAPLSGIVTAAVNGISVNIPYAYNGGAPPAPTSPATITSVSVTPATIQLNLGGTQQLSAIANYSDGSAQACSATSWSSSTPANASVTAGGLVTGVQAGTSAVTAICSGTTSSQSIIQIVSTPTTPTTPAPMITSVSVTPATIQLNLGGTQQLSAIANYSDGSTQACSATSWSSSMPANASVTAGGLVTALQIGTSAITATCSGTTSSQSTIQVVSAPIPSWIMKPL